LEGELSPRHRLVLQQIQGHIRYLEGRIPIFPVKRKTLL
jgi:hypothetical protein